MPGVLRIWHEREVNGKFPDVCVEYAPPEGGVENIYIEVKGQYQKRFWPGILKKQWLLKEGYPRDTVCVTFHAYPNLFGKICY